MPFLWVQELTIPQDMNSTPGAQLRGVSQSTYFLHNVNSYNEGAIGRDMVPLKDGRKSRC